jgi:hypothetical protein
VKFADAKTPVPQINGDRALYFNCNPKGELPRGVALSGTFEFQSLQRSNLEPLALASYLSLRSQTREIPCNALLR